MARFSISTATARDLRFGECFRTLRWSSVRGTTCSWTEQLAEPTEFLATTSSVPWSYWRVFGMSRCHMPSYVSLQRVPCVRNGAV